MLSSNLILPVTHRDAGEESIDSDTDIYIRVILGNTLIRISDNKEIGTDIFAIEGVLDLIDISRRITNIEEFTS